jgi:hypothetical protein
MKNQKSESHRVVEAVSRFMGAFAGTLVFRGKEMANCVKDVTRPKPETKPGQMPKPAAETKPEIEPIQKIELELMTKPIPKPESEVPTKITEKSVKSPSEKKSSPTAKNKKKTTSGQAQVRKKVERPKISSRGQNRNPKSRAYAKTKVAVETPETQGPAAEAKQSSGKSSGRKSIETN